MPAEESAEPCEIIEWRYYYFVFVPFEASMATLAP
jgi:hypothetical protein